MQTIVIATDGSPLADAALSEGLRLAADLHTDVAITSVWRIPTGDFGAAYAGFAMEELMRAEREHAERVLGRAAEQARGAGVTASTVLREGDPAGQIAAVADVVEARLIVAGSHGWGAVRSAVSGSVAAGLLHRCHRPVLLVREDAAG